MIRKSLLTAIAVLSAAVMLIGIPDNAHAFFDDPYIPFCHSGYSGGGDFYLGFGCRNCRARRVGPYQNRYHNVQAAPAYGTAMSSTPRTNQVVVPPAPTITQTSH